MTSSSGSPPMPPQGMELLFQGCREEHAAHQARPSAVAPKAIEACEFGASIASGVSYKLIGKRFNH